MKITRNMIIWVELKSGIKHIQAGRRPCIVVSCDKANRNAPVYTVIPGTTNLEKNHIPVHFEINPKDIKGYLKCKTMFLPEQIITINKSQVIQTAGIITNTEAIKLIDDMLIRQLQIGEYDGR